MLALLAALVFLAAFVLWGVPAMLQPPPGVESWLMFDGVCILCDAFVHFVADNDSRRLVKFGARVDVHMHSSPIS